MVLRFRVKSLRLRIHGIQEEIVRRSRLSSGGGVRRGAAGCGGVRRGAAGCGGVRRGAAGCGGVRRGKTGHFTTW
jgi:hypothetical protein